MTNQLIVLSGNVGVGKTTLGPYLAREVGAVWLPETEISKQFAYLFKDESRVSRIISQITFASLRVATVLSTFQSGASIVLSERFLDDSRIFHAVWRSRYALADEDPFFERLYLLLEGSPVHFNTQVIWLRCRMDVILRRLNLRREVFENVHAVDVVRDLGRKYAEHFRETPPALVIDTEDVSLEARCLADLAASTARRLLTIQ